MCTTVVVVHGVIRYTTTVCNERVLLVLGHGPRVPGSLQARDTNLGSNLVTMVATHSIVPPLVVSFFFQRVSACPMPVVLCAVKPFQF